MSKNSLCTGILWITNVRYIYIPNGFLGQIRGNSEYRDRDISITSQDLAGDSWHNLMCEVWLYHRESTNIHGDEGIAVLKIIKDTSAVR